MSSHLFGRTDIWESDSDEGGSDYEINEIPPPDIDNKFRDNVINVKHRLYEKLINEPEDNEDNLKNYITQLNTFYVLAIGAQSNDNKLSLQSTPQTLEQFPPELREQIREILDWISDYFSKNTIPDTIPYTDYIKKSLHDYQFLQHNSFE